MRYREKGAQEKTRKKAQGREEKRARSSIGKKLRSGQSGKEETKMRDQLRGIN